jgi:hypothetical protein
MNNTQNIPGHFKPLKDNILGKIFRDSLKKPLTVFLQGPAGIRDNSPNQKGRKQNESP